MSKTSSCIFYKNYAARKSDEGRERQQEHTTHTAAAPTLSTTRLKAAEADYSFPKWRGSQEASTLQKGFMEGMKKSH